MYIYTYIYNGTPYSTIPAAEGVLLHRCLGKNGDYSLSMATCRGADGVG